MLWIKTTDVGLAALVPALDGFLAVRRRWWQRRRRVRLTVGLSGGGVIEAEVREPGGVAGLHAALFGRGVAILG